MVLSTCVTGPEPPSVACTADRENVAKIPQIEGDIRSMAEDSTKVMERTVKIPIISQSLAVIRDHLGR